MTKEEAIELLRFPAQLGDPEVAHELADRILCRLLIDLGYAEVVDAFDKVEKWYS